MTSSSSHRPVRCLMFNLTFQLYKSFAFYLTLNDTCIKDSDSHVWFPSVQRWARKKWLNQGTWDCCQSLTRWSLHLSTGDTKPIFNLCPQILLNEDHQLNMVLVNGRVMEITCWRRWQKYVFGPVAKIRHTAWSELLGAHHILTGCQIPR